MESDGGLGRNLTDVSEQNARIQIVHGWFNSAYGIRWWARSELNRRSSPCEGDVITPRPRALGNSPTRLTNLSHTVFNGAGLDGPLRLRVARGLDGLPPASQEPQAPQPVLLRA